MRKRWAGLLALLLLFAGFSGLFSASADSGGTAVLHLLDLPAREQWRNDSGYCGETSIQTDALYYGTYISQSLARRLAGGELLVGKNDQKVLEALRLDFEEWDSGRPAPQYMAYLVWVKKHLAAGHPVILGVYINRNSSRNYDHVVPVVGCRSVDTDSYHVTDELTFHDDFTKEPFTRFFGSFWSTRDFSGKTEGYYIPKDVDCGVAVTGVTDWGKETLPVSLAVDSWDEPNVSKGESPKTMHATVTVKNLTPGKTYLLLKYTDVSRIPESDFAAGAEKADGATRFVAAKSEMNFQDSFPSDTLAAYRCVRAAS